jgi:hypothetical protein
VLECGIGASAAPRTVNTQAPIDPHRTQGPAKVPRVEVYWRAVTYKTVALYIILIAAVVGGVMYVASPNWYSEAIDKLNEAVSNTGSDTVTLAQTQARFVNLDGKVQVKKFNSVQWVDADYRTTLDKGDLVQTGSDGAARITFADSTSYTIKPDTLVTVEENIMTKEQASTAVRINTGSVDLSTPNWTSPNSKAAVSVEDTVAQIHANSKASVNADPVTKESEIVMSSGSAEVDRGNEKIELGQWQKATIPERGPIEKSNVLAPPELVEPLNLAPIVAEVPRNATIHFEWNPVPEAVGYTLRISTTSMFTKLLKEEKVAGTSTDVTGLDAGEYFWSVIATDAKKQTSQVSEIFKFTIFAQGKAQEMPLEILGTQMHGRVAEIYGKTEPGATLMVNGQEIPDIGSDGTFRYFTDALQPGEHSFVIIGQNRRGGTARQPVTIVVPK